MRNARLSVTVRNTRCANARSAGFGPLRNLGEPVLKTWAVKTRIRVVERPIVGRRARCSIPGGSTGGSPSQPLPNADFLVESTDSGRGAGLAMRNLRRNPTAYAQPAAVPFEPELSLFNKPVCSESWIQRMVTWSPSSAKKKWGHLASRTCSRLPQACPSSEWELVPAGNSAFECHASVPLVAKQPTPPGPPLPGSAGTGVSGPRVCPPGYLKTSKYGALTPKPTNRFRCAAVPPTCPSGWKMTNAGPYNFPYGTGYRYICTPITGQLAMNPARSRRRWGW